MGMARAVKQTSKMHLQCRGHIASFQMSIRFKTSQYLQLLKHCSKVATLVVKTIIPKHNGPCRFSASVMEKGKYTISSMSLCRSHLRIGLGQPFFLKNVFPKSERDHQSTSTDFLLFPWVLNLEPKISPVITFTRAIFSMFGCSIGHVTCIVYNHWEH